MQIGSLEGWVGLFLIETVTSLHLRVRGSGPRFCGNAASLQSSGPSVSSSYLCCCRQVIWGALITARPQRQFSVVRETSLARDPLSNFLHHENFHSLSFDISKFLGSGPFYMERFGRSQLIYFPKLCHQKLVPLFIIEKCVFSYTSCGDIP